MVPGIIEAVAKDFFDSEVTMTILDQSEEDQRTGKKEHVVFLVEQRRRTAPPVGSGGTSRAPDPRPVRTSAQNVTANSIMTTK